MRYGTLTIPMTSSPAQHANPRPTMNKTLMAIIGVAYLTAIFLIKGYRYLFVKEVKI